MTRSLLISLMLVVTPLAAQQSNTVQVESTISGNPEQPKTIYVLPWQQPFSVIRIPGQSLPTVSATSSPLDRQQFLRFITVQQAGAALTLTPSDIKKEQ